VDTYRRAEGEAGDLSFRSLMKAPSVPNDIAGRFGGSVCKVVIRAASSGGTPSPFLKRSVHRWKIWPAAIEVWQRLK